MDTVGCARLKGAVCRGKPDSRKAREADRRFRTANLRTGGDRAALNGLPRRLRLPTTGPVMAGAGDAPTDAAAVGLRAGM